MNLIACVDKNWGIGKNGQLLFHLPNDMAFFRKMTIGNTVVMGGTTFRSLPNGQPLAKRENLVLSQNTPDGDNYTVFRSTDDLVTTLRLRNFSDTIFICGGESIYQTLLPYCAVAYITKVDADGGADKFFPNLDADPQWAIHEQSGPIFDTGYWITFYHYQKGGRKR